MAVRKPAKGSVKGSAKGSAKKSAKKAAKKSAGKKAGRKTAGKKKASKKKVAKSSRPRKKPASKSHPYERIRAFIMSLPETSEKLSHGSPTFWGGKKTFATFADNHHGDGRLALWLKLPPGEQEDLVEANSEIFFRPPYVGPSGWVGVRLDRKFDWALLEMLLEQGYRTVAPSRAIAILEGG
jgi:hypothetical protein